MEQFWMSYVPRYVVDDFMAHPGENPTGREQQFNTVILFADISGFTALSEALGEQGQTGTEELTTLLNSYFQPMIDLIQSYGGIIGKFGGDSITALFRYTKRTQTTTTRRATRCALMMQSRMSHYTTMQTSAGTFSLTIRIGLAMGPVRCAIVGHLAIRLEYLIMGNVLSLAAHAEHQACIGQVIVHTDILPFITQPGTASSTYAVCSENKPNAASLQNTYVCLSHMQHRVPRRALPPLPATTPHRVRLLLEAFHHPAIALRLSKGQRDLINEHRRVTVMFVQFEDFDYDHDPDVINKLQHYFFNIFLIVWRYDGYLRQIEMGDKGSKYIVLFGAPVAHENDAERALRCALELQNIGNIPTAIGISTGFAYCGLIGSETRQEYTIVGDTVNLAARLMQAAQRSQIIVCNDTYIAAHRRLSPDTFAWQCLAPLIVKGKSEPVPAYALCGLQQSAHTTVYPFADDEPMVGRQAEMHHVENIFATIKNNRGHILGITAEAGMGKSRLAAEIVHAAKQQDIACYSGACLSYATTASYLVWQELMRDIVGIPPYSDVPTQIQHIQTYLTALNPHYLQRMPLLSTIFNLPIPDNELTRPLDPRMRKTSLESLLVDCVRQQANTKPLMLLLEDCHWIDPLSHDLLEAIARSIIDRPVLIVVVYRPPESTPVQLRITHLAHFSELRLHELTMQEGTQLIDLKLQHLYGHNGKEAPSDHKHEHEHATLASHVIERIIERAQGNPFYIDEMLKLLYNHGLQPTDTDALDTLELPDSLHCLITSRIDQLQEGPKTTLKVASVIGRRFYAGWLWRVYPQLGTPELIHDSLTHLNRLELTLLSKTNPELEYLFKHMLTHEVAYASLSVATRAMLHEQVGTLIEHLYPDDIDSWIDTLAYHYGQSNNIEKQRIYLRRAGSAAQAAHAHDTAITYYQRLLHLLPEEEQVDILLELGSIWEFISNWDEAQAHYWLALALALNLKDQHAQSRCEYAMGWLCYLKGIYEDALNWFEHAGTRFTAIGDQTGFVHVLRALGNVLLTQSNHERAMDCFQRCHQLATDLGDQREATHAIANIGHIYFHQGDYPRTLECYEKWLYLAIELGDQQQVGYMLGAMGQVYWSMGNSQGAIFCYEQQVRIATDIGDRRLLSIACGKMAEVYGHTGHLEHSLACLLRCLHIGVEIGDRLMMMIGIGYIAELYTLKKRYDEAEQFYQRATKLGRHLNVMYHVCDFLSFQALMYWFQQRYTEAWVHNAEAHTIATDIGHKDIQFMTHVLGINLSVALEQIDSAKAISLFEHMLQDWTEPVQQATLHHEIWMLDQSREEHRQQAIALYQDMPTRALRIEYRYRYYDLTGEMLPNTLDLPELPDIVTHDPISLDLLLEHVDKLILEECMYV